MTLDEMKSATKALMIATQARCDETGEHARRVARVSCRIAQQFKFAHGERVALGYGALLHDVGKIELRDSVLKKADKLTQAETEHMRRHVAAGVTILRNLVFPEEIIRIVEQHHERFDGGGYPKGLKGEQIELSARIFAVADAYDAITNNRVYRQGRGYQAAAAEITRNSGKQFDPSVVEAFFQIPQYELEQVSARVK